MNEYLASTTLTADDASLVLSFILKVCECSFSNGKNVRFQMPDFLPTIPEYIFLSMHIIDY